MKFYLFNLTSQSLSIRPECSKHVELSVPPNAFAVLPTCEYNFILSSAGGSKLEEASLVEEEWQYLINLKKSSFCQLSPRHVSESMPEGCPWRIYRDQVVSLVLLLSFGQMPMKPCLRHLGSAWIFWSCLGDRRKHSSPTCQMILLFIIFVCQASSHHYKSDAFPSHLTAGRRHSRYVRSL
jgi:hypothetical protein